LIRSALSKEAQQFWNQNRIEICNGIIYNGKFERYFQLFSKRILPLIHNKSKVEQLLQSKNANEQEEFYEKHWNTRRWKWLFRLFFSRKLMGWLGRDPAFLDQVKIPVAEFIYNKTAEHLKSKKAQSNHILDFALTGRFQKNLPHYVREGNYEIIQKNLDRLVCQEGLAESAIQEYGPFDYFNLSNIFEYLNEEQFSKVAQDLTNGANPGAKMAYWNLMVERKISTISTQITTESQLVQLQQNDKGFF